MTQVSEARTTVRFTPDDLDLFGEASHDRNPLHLSSLYARNTPFGERVVFGVLGGLACLASVGSGGRLLNTVELDFPHPIFVGINYSLETLRASASEARATLRDGSRTLLKAAFRFGPGLVNAAEVELPASAAPRAVPAETTARRVAVGATAAGEYAPSWPALRRLAVRLGLNLADYDPLQLSALLWSSYLVGMELPGERALFSKLSLSFGDPVGPSATPLGYTAKVSSFDERFAAVRAEAELSVGGRLLSSAELRAFVRPPRPRVADVEAELRGGRPDALAGKVALVVGASRGLGAAITLALARRGCTVFANFFQNRDEAENLKSLLDGRGAINLLQGDAGSLECAEQMRQSVEREAGRLDILVCNACPPLRPLRVEAGSAERINEYVSRSLSLVSVPLSVFAGLLSKSAGRAVVISSAATQAPPAEWPHYVSAKWAAEGFARAAAVEYRDVNFLVVRPPKLLTDLVDSPLGRISAESPAAVATAVADALEQPAVADGRVAILESFEPQTLRPAS